MGAIGDRFAELRGKGEKALVLFVTAGDPSLDALPEIMDALAEGGADIIEVGIPFSDPIADGPTIQASSQRALDRGATPAGALDAIAGFDKTPLVLMGYYNPVLRAGLDESADAAQAAGVCATIVSDLTPEEADDWISASLAHGLDNIFLAAPTSTDERLDIVCSKASGFVYAVSRTGVTGAGSEVPPEVSDLVTRIKARTELPVCAGFGISTPDHVRMVCEVADGAVIGSWLVDKLANEWNNSAGRDALVDAIRALKDATRQGTDKLRT
ncbi:MAG: tryptophan synthase subunit alpha [Armatimonadetes bacterium]|nr:tryptophan synthase subunit alpha [Armatimonadota bacterium]